MNIELPRALACADMRAGRSTPAIHVETHRPPYSTLYYYQSEVDLSELGMDILEPLLHHLESAKYGMLKGQDLYDCVDHEVLIRLNQIANDVDSLPTKIWLS